MWTYHWFADNFKWTPQQVDELTLEQSHWLPLITNAQGGAAAQLAPKDD